MLCLFFKIIWLSLVYVDLSIQIVNRIVLQANWNRQMLMEFRCQEVHVQYEENDREDESFSTSIEMQIGIAIKIPMKMRLIKIVH